MHLIFSCGVSRAVHLKLVSNLSTNEFIKSFKKLISRKGKQNGWTVLPETSSSMTFSARKGLSGNSIFQGHHGGEDYND